MMKSKILALILAFSGVGIGASFAGEKIWVGLYLAENSQPPRETVLAPEKLDHRLHAVFGFKHYELIKGEEIVLDQEWQHWVVPRKDFFIRVQPLPQQPGGPKIVYYEIYQNGFILAKGRYEPREGTPLFINGPDFKAGRFIFVIEAR